MTALALLLLLRACPDGQLTCPRGQPVAVPADSGCAGHAAAAARAPARLSRRTSPSPR
jgi:hypothetical protein